MSRFLALACLIVTMLGALPVRAAEALAVGVDRVRVETLDQTVPIIGRVIALESTDLATRVSGAVDHVLVRVGDRVAAGDVVAVLDMDLASAERDLRQAEVAAALAAVASARAELDLRRQELTRLESLRRSPAFSEARYLDQVQEVTIREARLVEAEAAAERARAQLRLAEIALRDSTIRAPFAGVVIRRQADVGSHLKEGDPVVSLIDDRLLELEVDVPGARIAGLSPGLEVRVGFDDVDATATVRAILPVENPLTRTRTVRLRSDFAGVTDLAANRSVVVHVPTGPRRIVLTVHKDAILYRSDGTEVFRVVDGRAEARQVRLGEATGSRFEVISGLDEGEQVVTRGNERLQPGQAIRAVASGEGRPG